MSTHEPNFEELPSRAQSAEPRTLGRRATMVLPFCSLCSTNHVAVRSETVPSFERLSRIQFTPSDNMVRRRVRS